MTTTYTPTKTERALVSRNNSTKAAATQITGCAIARVATTATVTKTAHGLSNGNIVMIQGASIGMYNGVFTIGNVAANTFDYTIKADPGANPAGSVATVDLASVSTVLDLSTKIGALIWGALQNGNTGPTLAAQLWMGMASNNAEPDYFAWRQMLNGDVAANVATPFAFLISQPGMFIKFALLGNSAQAVEWAMYAQEHTNTVGN